MPTVSERKSFYIPTAPIYTEPRTSYPLLQSQTPQSLYERLEEIFSLLKANKKISDYEFSGNKMTSGEFKPFSFRGETPKGTLFKIHLFQQPEKEKYLIEIQRRRGATIDYFQAINPLRTLLSINGLIDYQPSWSPRLLSHQQTKPDDSFSTPSLENFDLQPPSML